jgi:hypothetical protein
LIRSYLNGRSTWINTYEVFLIVNEGDHLSLGKRSDQKEQQNMADLIRSYLDGRSTWKKIVSSGADSQLSKRAGVFIIYKQPIKI